MQYTYEELAKMIDHSLLHPTMTDAELEAGCRLAAEYKVASVCIKPYFVARAVELLHGSGVLVGAVIGFPHGNSCTESKRYDSLWQARTREKTEPTSMDSGVSQNPVRSCSSTAESPGREQSFLKTCFH